MDQLSGRNPGCTCTWIRGFGVRDGQPEVWDSQILQLDPDCPVDHRGVEIAYRSGKDGYFHKKVQVLTQGQTDEVNRLLGHDD
jgi:hypothetical protein